MLTNSTNNDANVSFTEGEDNSTKSSAHPEKDWPKHQSHNCTHWPLSAGDTSPQSNIVTTDNKDASSVISQQQSIVVLAKHIYNCSEYNPAEWWPHRTPGERRRDKSKVVFYSFTSETNTSRCGDNPCRRVQHRNEDH